VRWVVPRRIDHRIQFDRIHIFEHRPSQAKAWTVWENEILAPFLAGHPDTIRFTSYEEL